MKDNLKDYIARYVDLKEQEFEYFYSLLIKKGFAKKDFLLSAREICKHQHFILQGLVRCFYTNQNGVEKIVQFGIENWWITNLDSFNNQQSSSLYIQALEHTTTLSISKQSLEMAYAQIPKIERLFRIITEKTLIAHLRRNHFYMKASSKERYYNLVGSMPNFVQRVPQYMIASYLDVTPEYLSELRKSPLK